MRPYAPLGDRAIGVFAPSSPFPSERLEAGLDVLRNLGFSLKVHPQTHARSGYLAGEDAARRQAFLDLLDDPEVGAIMAARGGYGVHRWIADVAPEPLRTLDKPVVGFSDVCALHAALQSRGELVSLHAPVITQLADLPPEDHAGLAALLRDPGHGFTLAAAGPAIAPGRARGPLVGGCLSIVAGLLGTDLLGPSDGAILLLEEVGEAPYRLDRLLTHMRLAGYLDRLAGVAVGDLVSCDAPRAGEPTGPEVIAERLGDLGVPVLAGLPVGHGARNHAVPLGRRAELDADAGTLRFPAEPGGSSGDPVTDPS